MKITRLGPARPLLSATSLGGSGGTLDPVAGGGLVPTASGSNSWAWGSNIARISGDGVAVLGPFVNLASGSGITLAVSSNTMTITGTSALTVADEGTPLATAAATLDFVGAGVVASGTGATKTITIASSSSPLTTKGDLYTYSTTNARLAIGSNATGLIADSTVATGNRWTVLPIAGELLISDTPAGSPLVFADVVQNEAQDDLMYSDL